MEHFSSATKLKEAYQRGQARWQGFRKENERVISRALQVVETTAAAAGWGYANGRWGEVSATDASALAEIKVLGMPADLAVGVALVGVAFFKGFGQYDEHAFNLGTGSAASFAVRIGYEMGSKAAHESSHARPTTTRGAAVTAGRGLHGGSVHTVWEDGRVREAA